MLTAAKTISQVIAHTAIAFTIAYWVTGSVIFGGLAAILEPVINVAALPLHQRFWSRMRAERLNKDNKLAISVMAEKISQMGMHMAIAFLVMFGATGSLAFGGLAAILEPMCNVILLPFHDHAWEKIREKVGMRMRHPFLTA
jgi:uncharacterized membrane protein